MSRGRVTVEDGNVVSTESATQPDEGQTMTEVLEGAVATARRDNERFDASYDEELGYLRSLSVDHTDATDDEGTLRVPCFAAETGDDACPLL